MEIVWHRVLPVLVSILVIIGIAIIREYSKTLAAITATMPINIPLGMWIVFSGSENDPQSRIQFAEGMLMGIFPTVIFLAVVFFTTRAGWSLIPTLFVGYIVWGIALLLLLGLRRIVGF
jgi:heme A synthase